MCQFRLPACPPRQQVNQPWENAQAYVLLLDVRAQVAEDILSIFNSPDRAAALLRLQKISADYAATAPKLSAWMEDNLPQGFSVFALPPPISENSEPPMPWSASTKNSNAAPASPVSTPTMPRSFDSSPPCSSRSATNGKPEKSTSP